MSSGNTTRKRNSSNTRTRSRSNATTRLDGARKGSSGSGRGGKQREKASRANSQSRARNANAPERERLISAEVRHDVVGLCIAVIAIALFIAVVAPGGAMLTGIVSMALLLAFGVGAYIIPFFLLAWALSFFIHVEFAGIKRTGLGLLLVIVAIIGLVALYTPNAVENPTGVLFAEQSLITRGGYLGAGIAWVLITLFGRVIGTVVLAGVIVAGLFVAGLSVSELLARTRERRESPEAVARKEKRRAARGPQDFVTEEQIYFDENGDIIPSPSAVGSGREGRTRALPGGSRTRRPSESPRTMVLADDALSEDKRTRTSSGLGGFLSKFKREKAEPDEAYDDAFIDSVWDDEGDSPDDDFGFGTDSRSSGSSRRTRRTSAKTTLLQDDAALDAPAAEEAPEAPARAKTTKLSPKKQAASKAVPAADGTAQAIAPAGAGVHDAAKSADEKAFVLPSPSILGMSTKTNARALREGQAECETMADKLQQTLEDFNVNARVVGWVNGPTVTQFKIEMPTGVRVNKITSLQDDIALGLAVDAVRVFAPIPGTSYVGVEVPNRSRGTVRLADILSYAKPSDGPLTMAIGKDVDGQPILTDLAKMPHLLIAGTTGSGKSVAENSMIVSMLMRATPEEVRMILIDPKRVELSIYEDIPHLYVPPVTEPAQAASALTWGTVEMERRFKLIQQAGTKNIAGYNALAKKGKLKDPDAKAMPYLVIVIDELADLMMQARKDVETSICRIAQLGRAAGIHLIIATQRPSTDIVTGLIKTNITNRVALKVGSSIDSRVILDQTGAERLLGNGDMLLALNSWQKPRRIQGCWLEDKEIAAVCDHLREQGTPEYHEDILTMSQGTGYATAGSGGQAGGGDDDPLVWEAAEAVISMGFGSTSGLQRRLKVGYARAGRIMDMLEAKGIVGPPDGTKPREVLVDALELETLKAFEMNDDDGNGY